MRTKTVLIRDIKKDYVTLLSIRATASPAAAVEAWQKNTIHYQVHGTLPPVKWTVAKNNVRDNLVGCLIESARF